MRSELGKITLDKTFEEREALNRNIIDAISEPAKAWGIECLRYEIRDIAPPASVRAAMDSQAEAERRKRAEILGTIQILVSQRYATTCVCGSVSCHATSPLTLNTHMEWNVVLCMC